ncbi:hypothetical protein [Sagittula salina]|uniref:Uncharacterized protein n=1 Tax=Sagittula salina TaxID=2820268 RepID=A0A940MQ38_9RHOB|nr:hypothetical protein [Sagittula salina]MBP0481004.1 hypothetical protein [Sagittula salina]
MSSDKQQGCALVVPVCEAGRLEAQREEIAQTLEDLTADIRDLHGKIRGEERVKKTDVGTALADLRYWLKAARETEVELDVIRRREREIEGHWGLDLGAAYDEVCRRLDCIRAIVDEREVPE